MLSNKQTRFRWKPYIGDFCSSVPLCFHSLEAHVYQIPWDWTINANHSSSDFIGFCLFWWLLETRRRWWEAVAAFEGCCSIRKLSPLLHAVVAFLQVSSFALEGYIRLSTFCDILILIDWVPLEQTIMYVKRPLKCTHAISQFTCSVI